MFVLFTICLVLFRFCVFWRHYVFDYSLGFMFIFRTCLIMSDTQCLLWLHDFFIYRSRFWIALNCFLEFSCSMGFRSGHSNVLIELAAQKCVPLFYFYSFYSTLTTLVPLTLIFMLNVFMASGFFGQEPRNDLINILVGQ